MNGSVGASVLAHGVHYGIVAVGLLGLAALLGPQLGAQLGSQRGRRVAHDEHDQRVLAVQRQISSGVLGLAIAPASLPAVTAPPRLRDGLVPLAVVSSAAAAGVHAALGPAHFGEQLLFGLFFTAAALAQIGWAVAMVVRPTRALLSAAIVGNAAVITLWLLTRTIGLPGFLMEGTEAIGLWDSSCLLWELTVVIACTHLLRQQGRPASVSLRLPGWADWPASAQIWTLGSALVLGLLSVSGS